MFAWLPWKYIVRFVARSRGFIDPVAVYSQLQRFSQPAEVAEPIELLRAGIVFHARGLVNSKVIQHNLDWVWPYWVEKQFDPADPAFLPRAFSITHINLTHRNWSAIGVPGLDTLPIVDPRGLLTPFWDGWSIDVWLVTDDNQMLLPSRAENCKQTLLTSPFVSVDTDITDDGMSLNTMAYVERDEKDDLCKLDVKAKSNVAGWLIISARPYNPEGISFIEDIKLSSDRTQWTINKMNAVRFSRKVERSHMSDFHSADVYIHLLDKDDSAKEHCPLGMATAAAMYRLETGKSTMLQVDIPIPALDDGSSERARIGYANSKKSDSHGRSNAAELWKSSLLEKSTLSIPNEKYTALYESAVRTLVLCTPGDVYAGPYTYKRFWYRDAVFIAHGLLSAGLVSRAYDIIKQLPLGQKRNGYFHSQAGEWDSNGQVLWLIERYCQLTGTVPEKTMWSSIEAGADWLIKKRLSDSGKSPWDGLLPAGFSAEHLGPNDYYYWDDFWGVAGLESAARLATLLDKPELAHRYTVEATAFSESIDRSIAGTQSKLRCTAIPASPMRRLDAGAIGSIITSYPLQLCSEGDEQVMGTIEFLLEHCFFEDGFFQDMIHSGVNAYLTLQIAQVLLRAGDERYLKLMNAMASLASPTGHWPEAVHPATGGGCMGDGHHAWAAAEWIAMIKNIFIREEKDSLILGSGIPSEWLTKNDTVSFGPTPTRFGSVCVRFKPMDASGDRCEVSWQATWHSDDPKIEICVPGYTVDKPDGNSGLAVIHRN